VSSWSFTSNGKLQAGTRTTASVTSDMDVV
jgi:hypothetical protein